ncbi:MAG: ferredoxin [Planctomycetes bacterium]|nr:ferredoxin [Planctomycetota bacterium]
MGKVLVDGHEIEISDGERLNGIEVARRAGIKIPHYCWHPGLSVVASCRICLVETGRRNPKTGAIEMLPKLVPACQTPATDGTVFVTNSEKVVRARAMVEEDLLLRHPIDCPICDKAGECKLQDYYQDYGQAERRADIKPFTSRRRSLGNTVTLFVDRCIMCSRCVRFCREVTGTGELMIAHRGTHEEIDVFPGYPLDNPLAGNVVDLCPVGALCDKDFLYRQRVWFLASHPHVCTGCSTGCSILVEENQDRVYRLKPRKNPRVNRWWMCDEGRYGWKHAFDERRCLQPRFRKDGVGTAVEWTEVIVELDRAVRAAKRLAIVLSPHLTVEEAYLLATYARQVNSDATLALGPVPQRGEDRAFDEGRFVIRREKCPNRRGVEHLLTHFSGRVLDWEDVLRRTRAVDAPDAVWIAGGYCTEWNDAQVAGQFAGVRLLVVQDLFSSPMMERADWQLPATASFERAGSFVNGADRLQSFSWAVRPPLGVMPEGPLVWRLLERSGLYDPGQVLREMASAVSCFAAAAQPVPDEGVDLSNPSREVGTR